MASAAEIAKVVQKARLGKLETEATPSPVEEFTAAPEKPKRGRPRKIALPVLSEDLKAAVDPQLVSVWERRMVNPGRQPSAPVSLKVPGWVVRFIDTSVGNRYHRAVYDQGWTPVHKTELSVASDLMGFQDTGDGLVRRGDKGKEVLMKMPESVFKVVQRRKAEIETESLRRTRRSLAEAAAQQFGANAGDFVSGTPGAAGEGVSGLVGKIVDSRETIGVDLEGGE